jgi:hypothetical protein
VRKERETTEIGNKVFTAPPTISVHCFSHVLRVFAYPLSLSDANSRRYGSFGDAGKRLCAKRTVVCDCLSALGGFCELHDKIVSYGCLC